MHAPHARANRPIARVASSRRSLPSGSIGRVSRMLERRARAFVAGEIFPFALSNFRATRVRSVHRILGCTSGVTNASQSPIKAVMLAFSLGKCEEIREYFYGKISHFSRFHLRRKITCWLPTNSSIK